MRNLCDELKWFLRHKGFAAALILTGVFAYGFEITHPSVGIDDTAVSLYLSDGLEVVMGRWTLFLINKVFHLSEFTPFMLELVGVLLLMTAAVLFCVLLRRLFGDGVGIWGYAVFACVFLSNPIISEVYVYYYHDGVDLGYVLIALALLAFMDGMEKSGTKEKWNKGKRALRFGASMLLTWAAVGCYESLLILYILGILTVLFLRGMTGKDELKSKHVLIYLAIGAGLSAGSVCLRSVMIALVTKVFGLEGVLGAMKQRSMLEMLVLFRDREGIENLIMLLKRFWVVYHVNAAVYLPVTVYEIAIVTFGVFSVCLAIKKKNLWYPVLFAGMYITPVLLTVAEARTTAYRSCQYLPFYAASGIFLLYRLISGSGRRRAGKAAALIMAAVLVWNQAYTMNLYFYVDWQKYENTKDVLFAAAHEIEREYGNDIPVVFTGHYSTPHSLLAEYYIWYGAPRYRMIASVMDIVDPYLKDKYSTPYGYSYIGEANNPFIQWAFDAFDGTNREMHAFLRMHGHAFPLVTDSAIMEAAEKMGESMPDFPREGSIVNCGDYIVVNF